jgi:hypothetical protein
MSSKTGLAKPLRLDFEEDLDGADIVDVNGDLIANVHSAEHAAEIVAAVNDAAKMREALEAIITDAESGQCEADVIALARAALNQGPGR